MILHCMRLFFLIWRILNLAVRINNFYYKNNIEKLHPRLNLTNAVTILLLTINKTNFIQFVIPS